jgi:hypothetical protein
MSFSLRVFPRLTYSFQSLDLHHRLACGIVVYNHILLHCMRYHNEQTSSSVIKGISQHTKARQSSFVDFSTRGPLRSKSTTRRVMRHGGQLNSNRLFPAVIYRTLHMTSNSSNHALAFGLALLFITSRCVPQFVAISEPHCRCILFVSSRLHPCV